VRIIDPEREAGKRECAQRPLDATGAGWTPTFVIRSGLITHRIAHKKKGDDPSIIAPPSSPYSESRVANREPRTANKY